MPGVTGLPGTAMVARAGSVRVQAAGGLADHEAALPCTAGTRFQLCSVSKQFTAAAVLLLAEAGRLDLHEPVTRWLPAAPPPWRRITLHHLLSHTAGVPHWNEAPGLDPSQPMGVSERLAAVQAAPLRTGPGGGWHYSSPGFILAGHIAERAAGQPYQEFLTERILAPLDLTETTAGDAPAGAASLRAMCTPHAPLSDDEGDLITTGYGYGMFTGTFAGQEARYHPGDNPGYQSFAGWLPDRSASIVILVNDEAADMTGLVRQLLPTAVT